MRIAIKDQGDGWVIDQISNDFKRYTRHEIVGLNSVPDIVWSMNTFSFPSTVSSIDKRCKSILQIHHVNMEMLSEYDFSSFDKASCCVVPNKITEEFVKSKLNIPVIRLPYWLLSKSVLPKNEDKVLAIKREICPNGEVLVGSFVKDGNGKNGSTPKISKNPDLFLDILGKLRSDMNIKVLLAGYARDYVKSKLEKMKIPYVYYGRCDDINTLYDCLDWYLVTSKYEGGPQSILEASYRKIKILSTRVGLAPEILHRSCICESSDDFVKKILSGIDCLEYNKIKIEKEYMPEMVVEMYDDFFERISYGLK